MRAGLVGLLRLFRLTFCAAAAFARAAGHGCWCVDYVVGELLKYACFHFVYVVLLSRLGNPTRRFCELAKNPYAVIVLYGFYMTHP